ncbi:MAG: AAA family ATPase [Acidimicrobiia bacterium]|nr:AAA family ATPase [Acidimicrobiia bacterium]
MNEAAAAGGGDPHAYEQRYIEGLYRRLSELRAQTSARLADVRLQHTRHQQNLLERDAEIHLLEGALARYDVGGGALCFGRIDMADAARYYIGRLGLSDESLEPLLVDWRAPAAEPFYRATPGQPEGVVLRRHLLCEGPRLVSIDDEVFDESALAEDQRQSLRGEAALMSALQRRRTGRMADIVATIQAEQDEIIRSPLEGVLLVQGGPGTGKTAVALHRAAYLLYTHRERLSARGVLIVGPSTVFLRYIEQVLPALGETGAVLARVGDLFPGVSGRAPETPAATEVKGRAAMVDVLKRAVRTRQRILREDALIGFGALQLRVTPAASRAARRRARGTELPHNAAKTVFDNSLLDVLVDQAMSKDAGLGRSEGHVRRRELRASLRRSWEFRAVAYRLWPALTPMELLADLLSARVLIRAAGRGRLSEDDVAAIHRPIDEAAPNDRGWSAADIPLLDEAAELLGEIQRRPKRRRRRRSSEEDEGPDTRTIEEMARADRSWFYGHVIVDEAQEVSPMAWRMLVRRCPQRSMTVVGDWAQRSVDWGAKGWEGALGAAATERLRITELSVNYRTPEEAMALAGRLLAEVDPDLEAPSAIRSSGFNPWSLQAAPGALGDVAAGVVAAELRAVGDGRIAVVAPESLRRAVGDALRLGLGDRVSADSGSALDRPVAVFGVADVKGLEFDSVVVVEPAAIVDASPRGANDLYVALTRTTNRLGLLHTRPLPDALSSARQVASITEIG